MFRSGTRMLSWSRKGQDNRGKQLTEKNDAVAEGKEGSLLLDAKVWRELVRKLGRAEESERGKVVDEVFDEHGAPQAGDVLVLGEGNNFRGRGKSHTAMVESYDAGSRCIYTIEGNTEHAVLGRKFDLTDAEVAKQIIFISRVGVGFFRPEADDAQGAAGGQAAAPKAASGQPVVQGPPAPAGPDGADLVAAAKAINEKIAAVARSKAWLKGASDDASTHSLSGGKDAADAKVH